MHTLSFCTISFLSGFLLMAYEMILPRMFAIYYGNLAISWGAIVGFVMIGLVFGNRFGDKLLRYVHSVLLAVNMCFLFIALYVLSIVLSGYDIIQYISYITSEMKVYGLLLCAFIFAFPLSFVFGSLSAILTGSALIGKSENAIKSVGLVMAGNNAGGIAGTFFSSFVMIPFIGIINSLWLICIVAFISSIYVSINMRIRVRFIPIFMVALALTGIFFLLNITVNDTSTKYEADKYTVVYSENTLYANISVVSHKKSNGHEYLYMLDGQSIFTSMRKGDPSYASEYIKAFAVSELERNDFNDILLIGAGGFAFPKLIYNTYEDSKTIDVVDIDERVIEIARKFFDVPESDNISSYIADGRRFIKDSKKKYDLVAIDVFHGRHIPSHMCTVEFFQDVKSVLKNSESMVVMNIIADVDGEFFRYFENTVRSVYENTKAFVINQEKEDAKDKQRNIVIVAKNDSISSKSKTYSNTNVLDISSKRFLDDKSASDLFLIRENK